MVTRGLFSFAQYNNTVKTYLAQNVPFWTCLFLYVCASNNQVPRSPFLVLLLLNPETSKLHCRGDSFQAEFGSECSLRRT